MPLLLELGKGERCIINGAVIESANTTSKIFIHNHANILRYSEIMTPEEAATPAASVYYALQCAYIFTAKKEEYIAHFNEYVKQFLQAVPSSSGIIHSILELVAKDNYYKALKQVRALLSYENKVLNDYNEILEQSKAEEEEQLQQHAGADEKIFQKPVIKPGETLADVLNDD